MVGFALSDSGDVIIESGQIQTVNGNELIRQTVKTILSTNKGEWFLNTDEGINFYNLLGKEKNDEIIKNEILQGLLQVDSSFFIDSFSCEVDKETRKLKVQFTAKNDKGDTVEGAQEWQ